MQQTTEHLNKTNSQDVLQPGGQYVFHPEKLHDQLANEHAPMSTVELRRMIFVNDS